MPVQMWKFWGKKKYGGNGHFIFIIEEFSSGFRPSYM